ncbi:hypothetical protein ACNKXS_14600 [Christiangramia marina]|uniref:hypothetical protein n=1 Tax=Christiangramia marina TaxID=409436 RepID=UPI003AA8A6F0
MKFKFVLIIALLFSFTGINAQEQKPDPKQPYSVTELKFETKKLRELTDFDWNSLDTIFSNNAPETDIDLIFEINGNVRIKNTKVDNIKFVVSGKTSELDSLKVKAQKLISKLESNMD